MEKIKELGARRGHGDCGLENGVLGHFQGGACILVEQLKREGEEIRDSDLVHLSPARYEHINPYGKYCFGFDIEKELARNQLRPLRYS